MVADREAQRPLALLLEEFDKLRLLRMGELPDGREIGAEGMKLPVIVVQKLERDAGIVLNERNRVLEEEFANLGEAGLWRR